MIVGDRHWSKLCKEVAVVGGSMWQREGEKEGLTATMALPSKKVNHSQ